jgi:hypothetical protein
LRWIGGPLAGTEAKEDDNPLPQPDTAPDRRGVADHQGEDIPVCKDRAKVEQRLGLFLASGFSARQRRPGNQDTGGTENAGNNKSAAPPQQRSDAAEQERQRRADREGAGVPGRDAGAGCAFDAMGERPQPGHIHAGHGDARQSAESERREQAVAQRHAEAGQRAKDARGDIELPCGPAIGQPDQWDDGEHIAGRDNPGEPAGLRIGQRPGLNELRQQRRNDRESDEAEDFGSAYGGNNRYRRCSRGGLSQGHGSHEENPGGGTGVLGVDDRTGGIAIDRLVIGNTASARPSTFPVCDIHKLPDKVMQPDAVPDRAPA